MKFMYFKTNILKYAKFQNSLKIVYFKHSNHKRYQPKGSNEIQINKSPRDEWL